MSVWVLVNFWLGRLYPYVVWLDRYNWVQALVFGAMASAVALAYARLVVVPLWRRTRREAPAKTAVSP